jgi:cation:H+ antiporter
VTAAITFLAGLGLLLIAGHLVVTAASAIGRRFGLNPMVVGLTIVAAGTSAPELAVVGQAVAANDTELAVGSIVGSNIANILLVLGLAATFGAITVTNRAIRTEIPVMIAASAGLLLAAQDNRIDRLDGVLMIAGLIIFVIWTISATRNPSHAPHHDQPPTARESLNGGGLRHQLNEWLSTKLATLGGAVLVLAVGVGGLAAAARLVVSGAEEIAINLGIPELIVGLTIVALGTSAPEIVTTIVATLQGKRDLAVGNAVGSNIFNILLVLGSTSLIAPEGIAISQAATELELPILLAVAVACLPLVFVDNTLDRWEGALFVAYYLAYLVFLVLDATNHQAKDPFVFIMWAFVVPLTTLTVAVLIAHQRRNKHRPTSHRQAGQSPANRRN